MTLRTPRFLLARRPLHSTIFLPRRWWALKAADPCSLFWAEPGWAPSSEIRPPYAHRQALLLSLAQGRPQFPHRRARYSFAFYYDSCWLQISLRLAPPMRTICLWGPHQELFPHYNTASLGKGKKSECWEKVKNSHLVKRGGFFSIFGLEKVLKSARWLTWSGGMLTTQSII